LNAYAEEDLFAAMKNSYGMKFSSYNTLITIAMNENDKELRLDREPDEERKSDIPLGDNAVKTKATGNTNMPGFAANENLDQTASQDVEDSPENDASTKES